MHILCDSSDFARDIIPPEAAARLSPDLPSHPALRSLADEFLGKGGSIYFAALPGDIWPYLVLARFAPQSQYDRMIQLARTERKLPDRLVCVAGSGNGFHGFKSRPWSAAAGNLHVTVHVAPNQAIERFETAFTVLAALSVVDTIDSVPGLERRAQIKWVNDVLVDGAKVAGTLAYTLTQGTTVSSAVIGIGLNVETAPEVPRTSLVPAVGALHDFAAGAPEATLASVLASLLDALDGNYRTLLEEGYGPLLARYKERANIVGRRIAICADDARPEPEVIREGVVIAMGDGLELYLDDGEEPVTRGRLVLLDTPNQDTTTPQLGRSEGEG
jgi:biotin-(acetyl-CoA carboxylase) ligase